MCTRSSAYEYIKNVQMIVHDWLVIIIDPGGCIWIMYQLIMSHLSCLVVRIEKILHTLLDVLTITMAWIGGMFGATLIIMLLFDNL